MCPKRGPSHAQPSWLRSFAAIGGIIGLFGCSGAGQPELLSVHRLEPERASAGDRVTVTGEGFPEGRRATITFRGNLCRPGVAPERDVRIVVPAIPAARDAVVMTLDPAVERRFVGSGEGALHTTFHGDVRVTFEPGSTGVASVSGTAHGVRFDVLPSAPPFASSDPDSPGASALAFLGVAGTADPAGRGFVLASVDPGGRAARAGLASGDLLRDMDGVTVLSEEDVRARGGEHTASVVVERAGRMLPPRSLDVDGLASFGAADLAFAAALVLLVCALLALPATRLGVLFRWVGRLVEARQWRRGVARSRKSFFHGTVEALLPPAREGWALGAASVLMLTAIVVAFVRLAIGRVLVSSDLDLAVLSLGAACALVVTRFVDGGVRAGRGWSLTAAFGAAACTLACVVPALGSLVGAVLSSGRFVVAEMVGAQGGVPWRWASMQNPGLFVLLFVLVASVTPEAQSGESLPVSGLSAAVPARASTTRALLRLAEWSYLWVISGLAVALFLGGWRVPGVASMTEEASGSLIWLGVALFIVKLWALVFAVGALRSAAGRIAASHVAPLALFWAFPVTLVAFALAAGFAALLDGTHSNLLADFVGYVAVALLVSLALFLGFVAVRSRHRSAIVTVNPWL